MTKIVGVRFRNAGKIYYFDPADKDMENGTFCSLPDCSHLASTCITLLALKSSSL